MGLIHVLTKPRRVPSFLLAAVCLAAASFNAWLAVGPAENLPPDVEDRNATLREVNDILEQSKRLLERHRDDERNREAMRRLFEESEQKFAKKDRDGSIEEARDRLEESRRLLAMARDALKNQTALSEEMKRENAKREAQRVEREARRSKGIWWKRLGAAGATVAFGILTAKFLLEGCRRGKEGQG
jgi:hypothetical protein